MIILLNKATRFSDVFLGLSKEYVADIRFGIITDTLDAEGKILYEEEVKELKKNRIEKIIKRFTGSIKQTAPIYSALKHQGKPLYKFARKGINIKKPPRNVDITSLKIINIKENLLTLAVSCSSGTYIRALAHDIGRAYGTGAFLEELRRTGIDNMDVNDSAGLDSIIGLSGKSSLPEKLSWVISLQELMEDTVSLYLKDEYARAVKNGGRISRKMMLGKSLKPGEAEDAAPYLKDMAAVRTADGKIIAVHRIIENINEFDKLNPDKVFTKNVVIF